MMIIDGGGCEVTWQCNIESEVPIEQGSFCLTYRDIGSCVLTYEIAYSIPEVIPCKWC